MNIQALLQRLRDEETRAIPIATALLAQSTPGVVDLRADELTPALARIVLSAARDELYTDVRRSKALAQLGVTIALNIDPSSYPSPLVAQLRTSAYKDLATAHRHAAEYELAHDALDAAAGAADGEPALEHDRAVLFLSRALTFADQEEYEQAAEVLAVASETFAEYEDQERLAQCRHVQGTCAYRQGRYREARAAFVEARAAAVERSDERAATSLLINIAVCQTEEGDYAAAAAHFAQAQPLAEELGQRADVTAARWGLARLELLQGRGTAVTRLLHDVSDAFLSLGMPEEAGLAALDEAEALLRANDRVRATQRLTAALQHFERVALPRRIATALTYLTDARAHISPDGVQRVRRYVALRPRELFAPPLA